MIRLLTELFLGADLSPITFELLELDELFLKIIKAKAKWGESPEVVLSQIKHRVAAQHPHYVCGGAFEALYYSEIWGLLYS